MELLALGISHRTADIETRERVALTSERLTEGLMHLRALPGLLEIAILSTCNRTELYCILEHREFNGLVRRFCGFHKIPPDELEPALYLHWNDQAVQHLMRVASGLDSMVPGEPQIFGQTKEAFSIARKQGVLGPELQRLAERSYAAAKRVRTHTAIGETPASVAYLAVKLAQRIFSDLRLSRALLIGAGETGRLVGRHLESAGLNQFVIANRTLEKSEKLAEALKGQAIALADLPRYLSKADIVVSCTGSQLPILSKGMVAQALRERRQVPVLLIDLAVPRDIEPEVASLRNAYLYSIDDLQQMVARNLSQRAEAAHEAERIILQSVDEFSRQQRALSASDTLVAIRSQFEQTKQEEIKKALAALKRGGDPEQLVMRLANQLTNKLLHTPIMQLKKAGGDGDLEFVNQIRRLFDLQSDDSH